MPKFELDEYVSANNLTIDTGDECPIIVELRPDSMIDERAANMLQSWILERRGNLIAKIETAVNDVRAVNKLEKLVSWNRR